MNAPRETGVALVVSLVALLIVTVIGVVVMGDVITQSGTVRNEQFRQRVFYATASELNANINSVNQNPSSADDVIINSLLDSRASANQYRLSSTPLITPDSTVTADNVEITASRNDLLGCKGESLGKVKVLVGTIQASSRLNDGKLNQGTRSTQRQHFIYCWP